MGWLCRRQVQRSSRGQRGRGRDLSKVYSHITQGGGRGRGARISLGRSQELSKPRRAQHPLWHAPVGFPRAWAVLIEDALMTLSPVMLARITWSSLGLASPGRALQRWRWP